MSVVGSPRFGVTVDLTESNPAGAGSAVATSRLVQVGSTAASPTTPNPANLTPGAGASAGANIIVDGLISLGASATLTIDLTNFAALTGAKTLAKCRGYHILNTAAAEAGASFAFTVSATAANGFTAGGKIPPSTAPATVEPNSFLAGSNLNIAGWPVGGTAKTIIITAGTSGASGYLVFFGE